MTVVAAAVVGSTLVGGVISHQSAKAARKANQKGVQASVDATLESTRLQLAEIQRQYDYQQRVLLPQIQEQYNAQRAYSDLLGIGGPQVGQQPNAITGYTPQPRSASAQAGAQQREIDILTRYMEGASPADRAQYQAEIDAVRARPTDEQRMASEAVARGPTMGAPGSSGVNARRDQYGAFQDPNLNPTRLADAATLSDVVAANQMAGTSAQDDPYRNYLNENRIAAGSPEEDLMVRRTSDVTMTGLRGGENISDDVRTRRLAEGAAGTGVYGDVFQESPGYAFQREEMERQLQRVGSAGGPNIGGRAIMEAQRRAQGLAAGDYYNWAAGRTSDLQRRAGAESTDASRFDAATYADVGRRDQFAGTDLSRGDEAYAGYERQRIADVGRMDEGYQNYLRRREGDVGRTVGAAGQVDALMASDLARQDQGYYNYLQALRAQAGFGAGPAATAVNASQVAGGATTGAIANQGSQLSATYSNQGASNANLEWAQGAALNNMLQGGVSNYITAGYAGANIPGFRR